MLGVTRGRGNTVDEVLTYLRRSVMADGTRPNGTIYFMWNKDVRSFARDKCFPAVAAQINAAGGHAVVQQGRIPTGAKDVAGMMVGTADFNLAKEGVKILPGAICEHLTSDGGIITPGDGQTPLSEFLRAGAAGASGTVAEPRALQAKFPLAFDPIALRPRLLARRSVLSIGQRPLPTAHRRRSALPTVGHHSENCRRRRKAG